MSRVLKDPLFHFVLIGAALFLVFGLVNEDEVRASDEEIVVSAGRIEQLANIYAKTWQRPPTREELQGLIDDFITEEIYYRRAVEMGIDRDDTVIRRRLRQKLEFLTDDAAGMVKPTEDELKAYLAEHPEKFRRDSTYTFRQIYIIPDRHGEDLEAVVQDRLTAARAGEDVLGDSGLLPSSFEGATARVVDGTFGRGFAASIDGLELGRWQGPVESGLGIHLVLLDSREPGAIPDFAEIQAPVEREWANQQRIEVRQRVNDELRAGYEIVIEMPEGAK